MITAKDKALAAMTEARRHRVKAQLFGDPFMWKGHEDAAAILDAIADDYAEECGGKDTPPQHHERVTA